MAPTDPHRNIPLLEAFALGKVARATADTVVQHLETCVECQAVVAAAPADPFLNDLREAVASKSAHSAVETPPGDWATVITPIADRTPTPPRLTKNPIPPGLQNSAEYEVVRDLGQGGMGVVYLVRNRGLDRLEALKVVKPAQLDFPGAIERFEREMRAAARLDHPNIVKAHHSPRLEGLLAFSMEFVDGIDLHQYVDDHGSLPISNACYYVSQVAKGLQHAHENGMVHRDIKPNNLILVRDGKKQVVKILDFGLAKAASENSADGNLTGSGAVLGTPDYIAPEQIGAAATADIRADIYSLGCTLHYLLTGQPPFPGKQSAYAKMHAHATENPRRLNELRQDVPPELAEIAAKMMAKDSAHRFQTPAEVAAVLAPFFKPGIKPARTGLPPGKPANSEPPGAKEAPLAPPNSGARPDPKPPQPAEVPAGGNRVATIAELVPDSRRPPINKRDERQPADRIRMDFRSPKVRVGLVASLLIAGWLAAWAGGLIRVHTEDGILVINVNVDNPDVFVNGKQVTIKWDSGAQQAEVGVRPGERLVEVRKEGYRVAAKELTFKEGKRTIFEARLEPVPPAANSNNDGTAPRSPAFAPGRQPGERLVINFQGIDFAFRWCPPGVFKMGSPVDEKGHNWDENQVDVTLTQGYWALETEFTQAMWVAVMGNAKSAKWTHGKGADFPAYEVDWEEVVACCQKLTDLLREKNLLPAAWEIRLPTEAEWEYLCRAGTSTRFSYGDDDNRVGDFAWFRDNSGGTNHTVRGHKPNPWGLHDVHGSVWEWLDDWYAEKLAGGTDPRVPPGGSFRAGRGGGWGDAPAYLRSARRFRLLPSDSSVAMGFRPLAVRVSDSPAPPAGAPSTGLATARTATVFASGTQAGDRLVINFQGVDLAFRWCPPGKLKMGSPASEQGHDSDETQVDVTLTSGCWALETEFTQAMWIAVMGNTKSAEWTSGKGDDIPVYYVDWNESVACCRQLTLLLRDKKLLPADWEIRLPTEAEWEYLCRAGTTTRFSFGDDDSRIGEYAWFDGNSGDTNHAVRGKLPNRWGLYDVHGSVWEWTSDWYAEKLAGGIDPRGVSGGTYRVDRGGCWSIWPAFLRSANRNGRLPSDSYYDLGFRPVAARVSKALAPTGTVEATSSAPPPARTATAIAPGKQAGERLVIKFQGIDFAFRWCPPGKFIMGSPSIEEAHDTSENQVDVTLTQGYWALETEFTQAMWIAVMGNSKSAAWTTGKGGEFPAYEVSWSEVVACCDKLTELLREKKLLPAEWEIRLPSEAEWEYLCRAGTTTRFSFGDDESRLGQFAWFVGNSGGTNHVVRGKKPNPWGLYDVHGSVWEWTSDWHAEELTGGIDPRRDSGGTNRVVRGGSWNRTPAILRSAYRFRSSLSLSNNFLGFRPLAARVSGAMAPTVDATPAGQERDDNGLKMKLVRCPPGTFTMGSPASEMGRSSIYEEQVRVTLTKEFWIGKYEVTQAEYEQVMGSNPSYFSKNGMSASSVEGRETAQFPVENVSWNSARDFCRKFTQQERSAGRLPAGWEYTLPTEAQWEYACRAESKTPFSFGTTLNGDHANCKGTVPYGTKTIGDFLRRPTTVGSYTANSWGLYDMHGNVSEWCLDAFQEKLPGGSDPIADEGSYRVERGGSWEFEAGLCRTARRKMSAPTFRSYYLGFRLALSPIQ